MMKSKTVILCLKLRKYCKIIAIDLSKQKALDADPEPINKTILLEILSEEETQKIFFIIEEAKEIVLDFSQGIVRVFTIFIHNIHYIII